MSERRGEAETWRRLVDSVAVTLEDAGETAQQVQGSQRQVASILADLEDDARGDASALQELSASVEGIGADMERLTENVNETAATLEQTARSSKAVGSNDVDIYL
jgi:methyl-accepting chemotaxis protein